jgi:hypothetical protein
MRKDWKSSVEAAIDAEMLANDRQRLLMGNAISNIERPVALANTAALTTSVMCSVALPLPAGKVIANLTFITATTAAGTPTNYWFALYSPAGALLRQTADQESAAWAANTVKTLALSSPYTVPTTGVYYASIMVNATTVPTLSGVTLFHVNAAGAVVSGMAVISRNSGTALTTTAPATIATPTTLATVPLVIAD